ncbi:transferase [Streptomyces albidoflavus]|uniref:sugar O-acetyltransferase n=1 Tax=Streptomyces albidoflavus TaxID=1886 RepID=UPI000BADE6FB|nr:sugar O-acetyltransferase [Streptomyces albidoflavus]PAX82885.1 transferase [Streptomyces albidoflavus]PAX91187.1 transferase [Streptomyces albidoflavus]PBO16525.1 transferase [Streptomyces albidoflavus]PBO25353.1 transferase [Streptomyces albidoflavus]PBO30581.1 transferase [Streptomyces albidoflavus]
MPDQDRLYVRTPEFVRVAERIAHVTALTSRLNVLPFDDEAGRAALLTEILGRPLPATATLYPPFHTDHGLRIDVGEHVFVNQGCTFFDQGGIRLGHGVLIGPRTSLISSDHPLAASERADYITRAPVTVEAGAWLGAAVTVLPGVTIGRGAVVGAGSVVTKDVPPHTLVTGEAASVRKRWEE